MSIYIYIYVYIYAVYSNHNESERRVFSCHKSSYLQKGMPLSPPFYSSPSLPI